MCRYVCSLDNMRIHMNLLRVFIIHLFSFVNCTFCRTPVHHFRSLIIQDSNKSIQVEAFQVFKLFPANQRKPPEIVNVLVANRSKLIRFFSDFSLAKGTNNCYYFRLCYCNKMLTNNHTLLQTTRNLNQTKLKWWRKLPPLSRKSIMLKAKRGNFLRILTLIFTLKLVVW